MTNAKSQSFTHVSTFNHQRREPPPGRLPGRRRRTRSCPHRRHRHRPVPQRPGPHHSRLSEGLDKGWQLEVPRRARPCYGGMEKAHCKAALHSHSPLELPLRDVLGWGRETLPRESVSPLPPKGKCLLCGWAALPPQLCSSRKGGHLRLSFSHPVNNEAAVTAAPPWFVWSFVFLSCCAWRMRVTTQCWRMGGSRPPVLPLAKSGEGQAQPRIEQSSQS